MSKKSMVPAHHAIVDGDMTSVITSAPTNKSGVQNLGYEVSWAGAAPLGTITVQVSVSYEASLYNKDVIPVWVDLPLPVLSPQGSNGSTFIDLNQAAAPWVRLVYTPDGVTPGTGLLNAWIWGKDT